MPLALGCFSLLCGFFALAGAAAVGWFGSRSPELTGPMALAAGALLLGAAFFGLLSGVGGAIAARRSGGSAGPGYAGAVASFLGMLGAGALVGLVFLGRLPAPRDLPPPPVSDAGTEALPEVPTPEPPPAVEEPTPEPEAEAPPSTAAPAPRRPAPRPSRPPATTQPARPVATPEPEPEEPEPTPRARPRGPLRVGGEIREPRKLKNVAPEYPPIARKARVQGVVILECTIGPRGNVTDVKVLRSIPLLDDAAVDAVKQWTYEPTLVDGQPTSVIMTVTVNFRMQ